MKYIKYLLLALALVSTSCSNANPSSIVTSSEEKTSSIISESSEISLSSPSSSSSVKPVSERFKENYKFQYFVDGGKETAHIVTDGLIHYEHTMTKINGDKTIFHTLEIDLNKVNIVAGSKDNKSYSHTFPNNLEVPYKMGEAYTRDTGKKVLASINADFFNPDPAFGKCVNAFVKDGFIVKECIQYTNCFSI